MNESVNKYCSKIKKRSANWESREKNLLKNCIKRFVSIIENKNTDTITNKSKAIAWQTVSQSFNELNHRVRSAAEVRQQWRMMKLDAKKNMSEVNTLMSSTGSGSEPTSPNPDPLDIMSMRMIKHDSSQEFETDYNVYDRDGIGTGEKAHKEDSQASFSTMEDADDVNHHIDNPTQEPLQKPSKMKWKMTFNNKNKSKYWGMFAKERNHVLLNCVREEHALKMRNYAETHKFATDEHNLKIQHMKEAHELSKEEAKLKIEKLKLEILMLQQTTK